MKKGLQLVERARGAVWLAVDCRGLLIKLMTPSPAVTLGKDLLDSYPPASPAALRVN